MNSTNLGTNAPPRPGRHRFYLIDQEQLAAQIVAVMNAHLARPTAEEKRGILRLAERQITDGEEYSPLHEPTYE